jgi:DNA-binding NarL/FixJ family response regulator
MIAMSSEIRLLLIDDHSLFRESLSRLLQTEADFHIVATCASASEAFALPHLEEVNVVLLDYDLGPEQGTQFLDRARSARFPGRILMVTAGMSDSVMLRMLENGASGVFLKHSPPSRLVEAIRKVFAGEVWLDPAVTRSIIAAATGNTAAPRRAQGLTQREQAVLKGVFEGLTNKEIGARLEISESSVKAVLQQLFEKTGVRTRSQLVRIALEKHSEEWLTNPT